MKEYQEREIFAYGRYIQCQILNWNDGPPPPYLVCNPLDGKYSEEFIAKQGMGTWMRVDLREIVNGFQRAHEAEKELAEIRSASAAAMEDTGQAYAYVGIRDYAALRTRLDEAERLLAALWRYGQLHQVKGVIYPETGSHKDTLKSADDYLFRRAQEKANV